VKKRQTSKVITARHPDVKLDFKHVVWTARMYDEFDQLFEVDFVIIHQGAIHSASDAVTGEVIPLSKLKGVERNLQNKVWDKFLMYAIFRLYS
jgi:hypothetical protein